MNVTMNLRSFKQLGTHHLLTPDSRQVAEETKVIEDEHQPASPALGVEGLWLGSCLATVLLLIMTANGATKLGFWEIQAGAT